MKIIVAITGASGVILGQRLLEELGRSGHETHLIVSEGARAVAKFEEGKSVDEIKKLASKSYSENELTASIASSSFLVDAMVVVPCSMKTLSAIANGFADNLIVRAAENALKMGWKLVVVPRDTPLSLAAIENMRKVKLAGGIILPPAVAYYPNPKRIQDVTDFFVGRILDVLRVDHELYKRWKQ
ncbi:MAG: UbiX family flavin prenyltransferase [Methanobacteriota archaeon]